MNSDDSDNEEKISKIKRLLNRPSDTVFITSMISFGILFIVFTAFLDPSYRKQVSGMIIDGIVILLLLASGVYFIKEKDDESAASNVKGFLFYVILAVAIFRFPTFFGWMLD